jgi:thiol-disulfide isomerase/thioredoxin
MDRLPAVIAAAALAAVACKDSGGSARTRDRVNAVKAATTTEQDPAAMCDRYFEPATAPAFAWTELTGPPPATEPGAWRWINVWATWCEPCVEELPRLSSWRARLARAGIAVDLVLVSADDSDEEIDSFRQAHPETPQSARLAHPERVAAWIASLGLTGASLPVHLFVDPAGKVRCVRASAVEETDHDAVQALLRR